MPQVETKANYRARMAQRQSVIIGTCLVLMVIATAFGLVVGTGLVKVPDPGFQAVPTPTLIKRIPVCPTAQAVTGEITDISVNIYNGTKKAGLAGSAETNLKDTGLTVLSTGDWAEGAYDGNVLLTAGPAGITNAYTVAQVFSGTVVVQQDPRASSSDTTVNVILGAQYNHGIKSAAEMAAIKSGSPITAPAGCSQPTAAASEAKK